MKEHEGGRDDTGGGDLQPERRRGQDRIDHGLGERAVIQAEASCNGGQQFAPLGVDTIPKGRLCGSSPVTDGQHIERGGESDEH